MTARYRRATVDDVNAMPELLHLNAPVTSCEQAIVAGGFPLDRELVRELSEMRIRVELHGARGTAHVRIASGETQQPITKVDGAWLLDLPTGPPAWVGVIEGLSR